MGVDVSVCVWTCVCVCWTILKSIKLANSSACKTWPKANTCGPRQVTKYTHTIHTHTTHTSVNHTHTPLGLCAHLKARLFIEDCDSRWPQQVTHSLALPLSLSPSVSLSPSLPLCPLLLSTVICVYFIHTLGFAFYCHALIRFSNPSETNQISSYF